MPMARPANPITAMAMRMMAIGPRPAMAAAIPPRSPTTMRMESHMSSSLPAAGAIHALPVARRCAAAGRPRLQQTVAQGRLLLRRGVPLGDVREVVRAAEPEQLQEQRRRAVQHGAELRAPGLLDQA